MTSVNEMKVKKWTVDIKDKEDDQGLRIITEDKKTIIALVYWSKTTSTDARILASSWDLLDAGKAVFFARNNPALTEENKERCWKQLDAAISKAKNG